MGDAKTFIRRYVRLGIVGGRYVVGRRYLYGSYILPKVLSIRLRDSAGRFCFFWIAPVLVKILRSGFLQKICLRLGYYMTVILI